MKRNDDAVIAKSMIGMTNKIPFRIHQSPTIKLYPADKSTTLEYFDNLDSLEGYVRFVKEEGSIDWFKGKPQTDGNSRPGSRN